MRENKLIYFGVILKINPSNSGKGFMSQSPYAFPTQKIRYAKRDVSSQFGNLRAAVQPSGTAEL
jgi:hypothetical protein